MADCDVKKTEKTLSDRFSKLSLNSVSVLERGILLYLIVSYCIFKLDRTLKTFYAALWEIEAAAAVCAALNEHSSSSSSSSCCSSSSSSSSVVVPLSMDLHWRLIYSVDKLNIRLHFYTTDGLNANSSQ